MSDRRVWTIEIAFTDEEDGRTRADALLQADEVEIHGSGHARRNPDDPDRPAVGRQLAAARALADVTHTLLHEASVIIEAFEGHPVHGSLRTTAGQTSRSR